METEWFEYYNANQVGKLGIHNSFLLFQIAHIISIQKHASITLLCVCAQHSHLAHPRRDSKGGRVSGRGRRYRSDPAQYAVIEYCQKLQNVSRLLLKNTEAENFPSSEDSKVVCPLLYD
jgi:hypothetical protein